MPAIKQKAVTPVPVVTAAVPAPAAAVSSVETESPVLIGRFGPLTTKQILSGKARNRPLASRVLVSSELEILHNRTMHTGAPRLLSMAKHNTAIGICATVKELSAPMGVCIACFLGKFAKLPAPASFSIKPLRAMDTICSDTVGPFRVRSFEGHWLYFQLHSCQLIDYLWVDFHSVKSTAIVELMAMDEKYAAPLGLRIKCFQSDSDVLYKDAKLKACAAKNGITLQYTAPYRHEGSIEAKVKVILDMVRTVIVETGVAEQHWATLVESAVYVHNRMPTTANPRTCPLTELTGEVPDISGFVPLGVPAICKIYDEEKRTSLSPKGEECIVLGYSDSAYKVLTKSGRSLIRKDVIVDENWVSQQRHRHRDIQSVPLLAAEELRVAKDDSDLPVALPSVIKVVKAALPPSEPPPVRRSDRVSVRPNRLAFLSSIKPAPVELPDVPKNFRDAL
eukprot:gene44654-55567_t